MYHINTPYFVFNMSTIRRDNALDRVIVVILLILNDYNLSVIYLTYPYK